MAIIIFCAIGTIFCLMAYGYLQFQVSDQAGEGAKARERQQAVFPVSVKLYEDAETRGVITAADLLCFKASSKCPRPKSTPTP